MKQISVFIDSVFQNFGGSKEEIKELKKEMNNHLLEAVHELKLEGKTEVDAVKIAIERFGGEKEMQTVIGQLFDAQKKFARRLFYCALSFLIFSVLLFGIITSYERINHDKRSKMYHDISMILGDVNHTISKEKQDRIQTLIQGNHHIAGIEIYPHTSDLVEPMFRYENAIWAPETRFIDVVREGHGDDEWQVFLTYRSIQDIAGMFLLAGITLSFPLFIIWGIINMYHRRNIFYQNVQSLFQG